MRLSKPRGDSLNIKKCFDAVIDRIGEEVITDIWGEQVKSKAFIQPMRYKNKLYVDMKITELGFNDTECFLYLGPADVDFTGSERHTTVHSLSGKRSYNVSRADKISVGGEVLYIWAVLTPHIKGDVYVSV